MQTKQVLGLASCLVLFFAVFAAPARADQRNQATKVTFSAPVEVPGTVLPAGSYLFTVMPDDPDHSIVQIWSADHQKFFTTVMTVPNYRRTPTGQPVVLFDRSQPGTPVAVQAWFYPGDVYGHDFVYSKSRATDLAKETGQAVPSMSDDVAANGNKSSANSMNDSSISAMKDAQVKAMRPTGEEVDIIEVIQTTPQGSMSNPR
ncbi:MAG TPA: hypothetical protein VJR04_06400 [Terriglobales bacterium]|nr:hypothetical protein [Terriglobales bacterium]